MITSPSSPHHSLTSCRLMLEGRQMENAFRVTGTDGGVLFEGRPRDDVSALSLCLATFVFDDLIYLLFQHPKIELQ